MSTVTKGLIERILKAEMDSLKKYIDEKITEKFEELKKDIKKSVSKSTKNEGE